MTDVKVAELVPILQTAVGPMILISGVGLLLLTMTNRLGRVIDRARQLDALVEGPDGPAKEHRGEQLAILWGRARLIRLAIGFATGCALFAALLVAVTFLAALLRLEAAWLLGALFVASMLCLIASLLLFLYDVERTLAALKLELFGSGKDRKCE
ncbi:MAG: DUF2721 domain-containing protein [Planctomycetes bacterium]|nr:DUF2721 domain-containing protein [Planctomycetota bacterium]